MRRPSRVWIRALRSALLQFYDTRRRSLPWRASRDAYRVWVSEIMLQQTRVESVIPYYERWIERFPTLDALAAADLDDVLRLWEGLGYYSRARNLHRAALVVRERHEGRLPDDPDALRALPGIGDYTAGAIASIAWDIAEPAVDGNVRRVIARLLDVARPAPADLRRVAADLVPEDRPGDFNQALMELGATVCTPRSPSCDRCPVEPLCRARARGTQERRPLPIQRATIPEYDVGTAVLVRDDGHVLIARRPATGLLAGLWEFPGAVARADELPSAAAERAAAGQPARMLGGQPEHIGSIPHTFTHRREIYHAFRIAAVPPANHTTNGTGNDRSHAWVDAETIADYALPKAQRRIAGLVFDAPPAAPR